MGEPLEEAWESIVAQEGAAAAADPELSLGRRSRRGDAAGGESPPAELPRLRAAGPDRDIEVVETIGKGGMGQVDLVRQRCLRREVALKRLRAEGQPADVVQADARALVREALHLGALEHPNIVPIHLLAQDEQELPVLLMKRVSGIDWRALIDRPDHPRWAELPADRLQFHVDVLRQVCNAVHYAHSRGLLHRDIKPSNVMLGGFGEVYLLDWGLSCRLDEPADPGSSGPSPAFDPSAAVGRRPAGEGIVGTPAYFAPEMADVTRPLSVRTDVYLLGATLHHALTGRPRHASDRNGGRSALYAAYRSEPFAYEPSAPAELAALCNRACHRDPEQRPESALAFRQALDEFLQHRGSARSCQVALRAVAELRELLAAPAPAPPERLAASFATARAGLEQALEDWPGNEAARDGLQACLELRLEHELGRRNHGTAEELLLALPRPRPDLAARVAGLKEELEREARSSEQLRTMREDLDVTAAGRTRAKVFLGVGLLAGGGLLGVALASHAGWLETTRQLRLAYQLALPLVYGLGVFAARRTLLRTTGARRIALCAGLVVAAPLLASLLKASIPAENKHTLASVLQTLILTVMAIAFDPRIGWIALVLGLVAAGCVAWPDQFLYVQGAGTFAAFLIAAVVTQPRRS